MNKDLNNKIKKIACKGLVLASTGALLTSSTGCSCSYSRELAPVEQYDVIDSNKLQANTSNELLEGGVTQILNVPGEDWKLVVRYTCDDSSKRQWRITSDKFLYIEVNTDGLPKDSEVYIDNVHIDTSIKSEFAVMDGITQDSMDDRIHNAQLIGFPISDTITYNGVNAIEGCNQTFITGSFYGLNGYTNGSIMEKRYTEENYLEAGVYGNKIQAVYDLLIRHNDELEFRNVSVPSDFLVYISTQDIQHKKYGMFSGKEIKD